MKVIRVLIYEGPDYWITATRDKSYIKGDRDFGVGSTIKELFIDPANEGAIRELATK